MFLLHSDKIVVLLAALYQEVLAVDEVVGGDDLVKGCELLLVERYAAALYELAHLAIACENLAIAPALLLWGRGEVVEFVLSFNLDRQGAYTGYYYIIGGGDGGLAV